MGDERKEARVPAGRSEGGRRTEILAGAAALFASSGLKTSLREIADSCGILPGSLYHHFDSKEAIILELVQRYRADLDRLAEDAAGPERAADPIVERIFALGRRIAECSQRHRAALLLTLYEPPAVLGEDLATLGRAAPAAAEAAMASLLAEGRESGVIRSGIDTALLADRLCQSMLHVGVGVSHLTKGAERVPEIRIGIQLWGIAARVPADASLDRSAALRAARGSVSSWVDDPGDDRAARLLAAARAEFGRRGFESTTMRDIVAASGLSTGTVYRAVGSKDDLLASIMSTYSRNQRNAWDAVCGSASSPLEKLDALLWVNIQVLDRFSDEFKIQMAWLRQSPPSSPSMDQFLGSYRAQLRQVRKLLGAGRATGEFQLEGASAEVRARCVLEAVMMSPGVIRAAGAAGAHALARETVLRGAGAPGRADSLDVSTRSGRPGR